MSDLLAAAGGPSEPLQALLVGGYFGTWVEASQAASLRLAREDLRSVGCTLGSGVLIALGESACGLHESARVIAYLAGQSAGQCGPCVYGLRAIADAVGALAAGVARPQRPRPRAPLDGRGPRARRLPPPRRRGAVRRERARRVRATTSTGTSTGTATPRRRGCRSAARRSPEVGSESGAGGYRVGEGTRSGERTGCASTRSPARRTACAPSSCPS